MKKFSEGRLKDAVAESPLERRIELLILKGAVFEAVILPYAGGPKYIDLVRKENSEDLLARILAPRRAHSKESAEPDGRED